MKHLKAVPHGHDSDTESIQWENLNYLPSSTWRHMGVNGEQVELEPPKLSRYTGHAFTGKAPAGVEIYDVGAGEIGFMDDEKDPTFHPGVHEYVRRNHTAGFFVHKAAGGSLAEPLVFDYRINAENPALLDDNLIIAEENSEITVVMHYASDRQAAGLHCGMTKLIAKKGAVIRLIQVQTLGNGCEHFDNVGAVAAEGAYIEVVQAELGGARSYSNCNVRLEGDKSRLETDTLYLGDGTRKLDISLLCEQYGKKTDSTMEARGALLGHSEKIFRGTIDFKKGSAGSKGREQENTVLLSPTVRNRTAPLILCAEEDVDGRHAASAGRVDENRMFYLMSRGLSEAQAKKLIIEAEFGPIMEKIKVPAFQQEISGFLKERLDGIE